MSENYRTLMKRKVAEIEAKETQPTHTPMLGESVDHYGEEYCANAVNSHEALLKAMRSAILALDCGIDSLSNTQNCSGHESTMSCVIDDLQQAIAKAEGK